MDFLNWLHPKTKIRHCPFLAHSRHSLLGRTFLHLSRSSHFPLMLYSNAINPVALPRGRAMLVTYPAPTGSITFANTIGTLRVTCSSAATHGLPEARMTSGVSATNSSEYR